MAQKGQSEFEAKEEVDTDESSEEESMVQKNERSASLGQGQFVTPAAGRNERPTQSTNDTDARGRTAKTSLKDASPESDSERAPMSRKEMVADCTSDNQEHDVDESPSSEEVGENSRLEVPSTSQSHTTKENRGGRAFEDAKLSPETSTDVSPERPFMEHDVRPKGFILPPHLRATHEDLASAIDAGTSSTQVARNGGGLTDNARSNLMQTEERRPSASPEDSNAQASSKPSSADQSRGTRRKERGNTRGQQPIKRNGRELADNASKSPPSASPGESNAKASSKPSTRSADQSRGARPKERGNTRGQQPVERNGGGSAKNAGRNVTQSEECPPSTSPECSNAQTGSKSSARSVDPSGGVRRKKRRNSRRQPNSNMTQTADPLSLEDIEKRISLPTAAANAKQILSTTMDSRVNTESFSFPQKVTPPQGECETALSQSVISTGNSSNQQIERNDETVDSSLTENARMDVWQADDCPPPPPAERNRQAFAKVAPPTGDAAEDALTDRELDGMQEGTAPSDTPHPIDSGQDVAPIELAIRHAMNDLGNYDGTEICLTCLHIIGSAHVCPLSTVFERTFGDDSAHHQGRAFVHEE